MKNSNNIPFYPSNVILYGPPGSGKSFISKILSSKIGLDYVDVDDDLLEKEWQMSVSDKLTQLGDYAFLEEEAKVILSKNFKDKIISLTGSNPLHNDSMIHLKKQGIIIYLDLELNEIVEREGIIKLDRIVTLGKKTFRDVLEYRLEIYEKYYDLRLICNNEIAEIRVERIIQLINRNGLYSSTRNKNEVSNFLGCIKEGLAKDGGLFVPQFMPYLSIEQWKRLINYNFEERCLRVLELFDISGLSPQKLKSFIYQAYKPFNNKIIPLLHLQDKQYIMEEYYGPTSSFKDLALQLFSRLFNESVKDEENRYVILVATSGDTGSAVLSAFEETNIPVIVLYPYGKVSPVQEMQMIKSEGNVSVIGIKGDFDDCQSAVKKIFNDESFKERLSSELKTSLSSANSMNWGRFFPQINYSINSYLELVKNGIISFGEKVDVCIPSGNFGNILGCYFAKRMGIPLDRLICASNENNILTDFLSKGVFDTRERVLKPSCSPAIDILNPSNIERLLFYASNMNHEEVNGYYNDLKTKKYFELKQETFEEIKKDFDCGFCTNEEAIGVIKKVFEETNVLIDPHTAVAKFVSDKFKSDKITLIAGTAHYGKFPETIMKAFNNEFESVEKSFETLINKNPKNEFNHRLKEVLEKEVKHNQVIENDFEMIKSKILEEVKKLVKI